LNERRLLLATGNPGKVREIRRALKGLSIDGRALAIVGLSEAIAGSPPAEHGRTFEENARSKSLFYSRRWPGLTLAEDSGLEIDALGGEPGVRSARFSAPRPSDEKNIRKVLRRLQGVPASARKARFVCVMVLAERGRIVAEFRGEVRGRIGGEPRGRSGFGYDPIFYYPPLRRTFAELPPAVKNAVSHRGRAVAKLRRFLEAKKEVLLPIPRGPSRGGEGCCLEDPRPWRGDPRSGGNRTTGSRGAGELEAYPEPSRREELPGNWRRTKKKAPPGGRPGRA
jgi:XTP/dITP diphosphohydrolase